MITVAYKIYFLFLAVVNDLVIIQFETISSFHYQAAAHKLSYNKYLCNRPVTSCHHQVLGQNNEPALPVWNSFCLSWPSDCRSSEVAETLSSVLETQALYGLC